MEILSNLLILEFFHEEYFRFLDPDEKYFSLHYLTNLHNLSDSGFL